jgi:perosamine synthetase
MKSKSKNIKKFTVSLPENLNNILKKINVNQEGIVFVVKNYKLFGSISDGDIRRYIIKNKLRKKINYKTNIINKKTRFVRSNTSKKRILSLFNQSKPKIKILPVVNRYNQIINFIHRNKTFPLPLLEPMIGKGEIENVLECLNSGWISSAGKYVEKFENEFKHHMGGGYPTTVTNGTAAIILALNTFEVKKGDEVIVTNFTFAATVNAIVACGAKPVLVDINKDTWLPEIDSILKKITKRTKAIIVVHIYGIPFDVKSLKKRINSKILKKIFIIEDSAEALGTLKKGKQIGLDGDCATFSFYPNKNITTGEGGMSVFTKKQYWEKAIIIKNQGREQNDKFFYHKIIGNNFRITNLQAAIGCAQMKRLKIFQKMRKKVFFNYDQQLSKIKSFILLPKIKGTQNSYWLYTIRIRNISESQRNLIIKQLKNRGIETRPAFYPINSMPAYKHLSKENMPNSKLVGLSGISLPSSPYLSKSHIKDVCNILIDTMKNQKIL